MPLLIVCGHFSSFFSLCFFFSYCLIESVEQVVFDQLSEMEVLLRATFSPRTPWYVAHLHSLVRRSSWRDQRGGWSGLRMGCWRTWWLPPYRPSQSPTEEKPVFQPQFVGLKVTFMLFSCFRVSQSGFSCHFLEYHGILRGIPDIESQRIWINIRDFCLSS